MRREPERHPKHLGKIFLAAIIAIALAILIPLMPWIKPEIVESATVVQSKGVGCVVETEAKNVVHIDSCEQRKVGDKVTVKYRQTTSVGKLMP